MSAYQVDVDELALVVAEMAACRQALEDLASDVHAVTGRLHAEWVGAASSAHQASYAGWRGEFADMSAALAGMRDLGETAHTNYTAAVASNLAMWEQVR